MIIMNACEVDMGRTYRNEQKWQAEKDEYVLFTRLFFSAEE
jgi:hypothetical protein